MVTSCVGSLLKRVIEGTIKEGIEVTVTQGRRRKQLLDDLKGKRIYWKLKKMTSGERQDTRN